MGVSRAVRHIWKAVDKSLWPIESSALRVGLSLLRSARLRLRDRLTGISLRRRDRIAEGEPVLVGEGLFERGEDFAFLFLDVVRDATQQHLCSGAEPWHGDHAQHLRESLACEAVLDLGLLLVLFSDEIGHVPGDD